MSAAAKRITLDDLKEKAEDIRDTVQTDAKQLVRQDTAKVVLAGAVVVAVAVSFAFYMGTRRCRF